MREELAALTEEKQLLEILHNLVKGFKWGQNPTCVIFSSLLLKGYFWKSFFRDSLKRNNSLYSILSFPFYVLWRKQIPLWSFNKFCLSFMQKKCQKQIFTLKNVFLMLFTTPADSSWKSACFMLLTHGKNRNKTRSRHKHQWSGGMIQVLTFLHRWRAKYGFRNLRMITF